MSAEFLSAKQAAALLGIRPASLYAYVSRGLIKPEPGPGRQRRYRRADLEAFKARRSTARSPGRAARASLDFGLPVLSSAITLIEGGRLFYRGRDAMELARTASFESVAALLWEAEERAAFATDNLPRLPPDNGAAEGLPFLARASILIAGQAEADPGAFDRRGSGLARTGARILRLAACAILGGQPSGSPLHEQLAAAWGLPLEGADLLRAALALVADHELNPSTFAVRAVAGTGASLQASALAGLAALSGPRHGGMTARVEALFEELGHGPPERGLAGRLKRGESLPGFSHRLYPVGDPRARTLLAMIGERQPGPECDRARRIAAAARDLTGEQPNIDFALVALRRALALPEGQAFALFALGRMAGWIAHGIEQLASGEMIRPRAAYTGPRPELD